MKLNSAFLLATLSVLIISCGAEEEVDPWEYFPLEAGRTWTYKNRMGTVYVEMAVTPDPKTFGVTARTSFGQYRWEIHAPQDGPSIVPIDSGQFTQTLKVKFPLEAGAQWEVVPDNGKPPLRATLVGKSDAEVPAGEFEDCWRIQYMPVDPPEGGSDLAFEIWLARGVGIVRIDFARPEGSTAPQLAPLQLESYTKP